MPMAEPLSSSAPNSSSSFPIVKYDVFLCFRGDTRYGFTAHLYEALRRKGVVTFMDDEDFEMARPIDDILDDLRASRIAVVIFSKKFAASTYCLEELVTICECIDGGTQQAVPIFYHVDPSQPQDLLPKEGAYRKAFDKYRKSEDLAKVGAWKSAMKRVANIKGEELKKDSKEPEFNEMFVQQILDKLKLSDYGFSSLAKSFIGMDKHMEKMRSYLDIDNRDVVRFIVISGVSGIGKTAIAQLVYAETSYKFQGSSFLSDVSVAGGNKSLLVDLQKRLLSQTLDDKKVEVRDLIQGGAEIRRRLRSRRVLVVLDDVDDIVQLRSLIGVDDSVGWFGSGSRIIITTEDSSMFHSLGEVDKKIRKVKKGLNDHDALQLFCKKAFGIRYDEPPKRFKRLSKKFVKYTGGLPQALEVIGSSLCRPRSKEIWKSELERMKKFPRNKVVNKLQRSLERLDALEREVLLDIAFFFRGENEDSLIKVLDSCDFHSICGLKTLEDNSLITIQDSKVLMHKLIQRTCREFVRVLHKQPRERSRLWLYKDVCHAFRCNMGEINVEGISLESGGEEYMQLQGEAFTKLSNLRVLKFKNIQLSGQFENLPSELSYLQWSGYPFTCLPSCFVQSQLVELHLPSSKIEELWKDENQELVNLRVMDLRNCKNLKETINFKTVPNLEKLRLSGCIRLWKVNRYISDLKNLVLLDLEGCRRLKEFPKKISLTSLQNLNLLGCPRLGKLPKLQRMECLQELSAGGFVQPQQRSPAQSNRISKSCSRSLRKLHLTDCNLVEGAIPFDFSRFTLLESLNLSGNGFVSAPEIAQLSKLEVLSLANCKSLQTVPDLPLNLKTLRMSNCTSLTSLPSLSGLSKLEDLVMEGCAALETFPNPCKKCNSKSLHLNFASCLNLNDNEMQVSLSWLKIYLKMQMRQEYERYGELSMVLPRSTIHWLSIHWLWKDTGVVNLFKVSLPSNWFHENIMGFAICAVIDVPGCRPHDYYGLNGSLIARTTQAQQGPTRKHLISVKINIDRAASDHLWFLYIPRDYSRSIEWWNQFTQFKFEAQFAYFDFEVRKWGFSIIYKQDVEHSRECNISSENVDLRQGGTSRKRKRSYECPEDDNFLEFRLNDFRDDDDEEDY